MKQRIWLPAILLLLTMTVLTGLAYPLVVTGIAALFFPSQAGGSLIRRDGQVVGSSLIGQNFTSDRYFQGRPSATLPMPNNAAASSGSNLSPRGGTLRDLVRQRAASIAEANPEARSLIPSDLLTASGSGLDPDISPSAARYQAPRVARARGTTVDRIDSLIGRLTQGRQFGVLGEERVNVLQLNLALDEENFE